LSARTGTSEIEGWIGRGELIVSENQQGFRQIWSDTESASTHTLPNGFEGRALPWRALPRNAIVRALTGDLADLTPTSSVCVRQRGVRRPELRYRLGSITVSITLNPNSHLPYRLQAYASGHPTGLTVVSDIVYRRVDDASVPVAWQSGDQRFAFASAERTEEPSALTPIAARNPVSRRLTIPTIRAQHSNETAVAVIIAGRRLRFFIDSGATLTGINEQAAAVLGLKAGREGRTQQATGLVSARPAYVSQMRVGALRLDHEPVLIVQQTFGYDGMIGSSLFALGKVRITDRAVIVDPPSAPAPEAIPIDTYEGIPFATAQVGREIADLALDSGAAFEALLPHRFAAGARRIAGAASSCRIYAIPAWLVVGYFEIPGMRIGGRRWPVRACVSFDERAGHIVDGILGQAAIVRGSATFDYRSGTVALPPARSASTSSASPGGVAASIVRH
jgi:predicted aspartyl protease